MDRIPTITRYLVEAFAPDISAAELSPDEDLLESGVLNSIVLIKTIPWIEATYGLDLDFVDLTPDDFRTVKDIDALIERSLHTRRKAS
jgi:hypothetical protein